jgi:hypothetical protein
VQAVEVQTVDSHRRSARTAAVVERAQPAREVDDVGIAPHPGQEALKAAQRLLRVGVRAGTLDVAADAVGSGPVALDRHLYEAALGDQAARDPGPPAVELVRAVAGLAPQHQARVADALESAS